MVASKKDYVFGEFELQPKQQCDHLYVKVAAVDVVSQKDVLACWRVAVARKYVQQVMELSESGVWYPWMSPTTTTGEVTWMMLGSNSE